MIYIFKIDFYIWISISNYSLIFKSRKMSVSLKNAIFHSDKITKISEKLNSISVGVENDKYARVENVD